METVPVRLICFPDADPAMWWLTYYPPGGAAGSAGFPVLNRARRAPQIPLSLTVPE